MLLNSVKDAKVILSYQWSRTKEGPRNKTISITRISEWQCLSLEY